jgi:hypothetical protein
LSNSWKFRRILSGSGHGVEEAASAGWHRLSRTISGSRQGIEERLVRTLEEVKLVGLRTLLSGAWLVSTEEGCARYSR